MSHHRPGMRIAFFGISDCGLKRSNNEDYFVVADLTRHRLGVRNNRVAPQMLCHEVGARGTLLAVADGLGGYAGGEVASQLAVEATVQALFAAEGVDLSPAQQLCRAVAAAHGAISRHRGTAPGDARMSSTLTAMHVGHDVLTVAQVGDSRAYLFSHGKLTLLTEDQTMVHLLQKKGLLTDAEAHNHPDRHVVLQALGQGKAIAPEVNSILFQDGDCVLLCTDGLSSYVVHEQIEAVLQTEKNENARCQCLIDAAYAAGGADNVTVLLARLLRHC
jgi:serine/threonine protein phosphatase PrpC